MQKTALFLVLTAAACMAQTPTVATLKELSKKPDSPEFAQALKTALKAPNIQKGTAYLGEGPDFLFAVDSIKQPELYIDDAPNAAMKAISGSNLWYTSATLKPGRSHSF